MQSESASGWPLRQPARGNHGEQLGPAAMPSGGGPCLRSRGEDVAKRVRQYSGVRSTSAVQSQLPDQPTAATLSLPVVAGRRDPRQGFIFTTALHCRSSSDLVYNGLLHDSELTVQVVTSTLRPLGCDPSIHLTVPEEPHGGHRALLSQSRC